jgi:hypothetical protein
MSYHATNHALHERYPGNEAVIFDTCCAGPVSVSIHGTVLDTDGEVKKRLKRWDFIIADYKGTRIFMVEIILYNIEQETG